MHNKTLPQSHTKMFYIPNIMALALVVSDKKIFHVFSRWASAKHVTSNLADFVPQGLNLIILGSKVGKMPANKHICHASGIYREIPGINGKKWKILVNMI